MENKCIIFSEKSKCTETDALLIPYFEEKTNIPNEEINNKINILKKKNNLKALMEKYLI